MEREHYETEMEEASRCIYELDDIIKKIETSKLSSKELTQECRRLEKIRTIFDHYHIPKDDKNYRRLMDTNYKILGIILIVDGADVDDLISTFSKIGWQLPEWVIEEYSQL